MSEPKGTVDIRACDCKHDFQDKHYNGLRLHNRSPSTGSAKASKPGWRCTVCAKLK